MVVVVVVGSSSVDDELVIVDVVVDCVVEDETLAVVSGVVLADTEPLTDVSSIVLLEVIEPSMNSLSVETLALCVVSVVG